ncbi:TerB family tellurite resistance protein [Thalassotalea sp. LPB0316]|uniref:tellurite resistance TerB family protein n=1 Tax=Thalassotalea sp. LPB0316 TaxID=2769490 RepID=UPI001866838E|nr:TerB family tellurite resistance protein [Thalassotalea sp. LPB0316]QOL26035.1 TerB family tellurite resistance protein [Thalassotalea sp. LPB0316]
MLAKIKSFFEQLNTVAQDTETTSISLELACAVLLCEVMRADHQVDTTEEQAIKQMLQQHFHLNIEQVDDVMCQALSHSDEANDLYFFTSKINKQCDINQKIHIVELLWQLAYADGEVASIEHHIIRKIADLLHLRHHEYISAKTNALTTK